MTPWEQLLSHVRAEPCVVGVVLSGSRGRHLGQANSDWDCYVITDGSIAEADVLPDVPADGLDVVILTMDDFISYALPGTPEAWNAYAFAHVDVAVDRLDGEIARLAAAKEYLGSDISAKVSADCFDAFINAVVRSAKCVQAGDREAAALDATEAVAPALDTVFAINGRVRPFNRYLGWELDNHPLQSAPRGNLIAMLVRMANGDVASAAATFKAVEAIARDAGLSHVIDGWDASSLRLVHGR